MKYFEGSICVKHGEFEHWHNVIIQRQNFKQALKCLKEYCRYYYYNERSEREGNSYWFPCSMISVLPERVVEILDIENWKQSQFDNAII